MQPDPSTDPASLSEVIERALDASEGDGPVSVSDIVKALGPSSIVSLLLLPALIVATPLSGIPGVSSIGGLLIALIAAQIAMGRERVWLPDWLMRQSLPAPRLRAGLQKLQSAAARTDQHLHRRFRLAAGSAARRGVGVVCTILGAAMPLLEFVPFTSSIAAIAVATFATALLARDGLLTIAGAGFIALIIALIIWLI